MSEEVTITPKEAQELAARCWRSPSEFCRVFLPEWFPSKQPWFHRGLNALRTGMVDFLLDFGPEWWPEDIERGEPSYWTPDDVVKIVTNFVIEVKAAKMKDGLVVEPAVLEPLFDLTFGEDGTITGIAIREPKDNNAFILPRGFAKTTNLNAMNLRDTAYQVEKFILYVSETLPHASNQVMTLRGQWENNELLRAVFGNQVPDRSDSEKWGEQVIELLNGCRVAALGSGGQVRGIVKDSVRPTRIVVDDFQNEEGCKSPTQREKDIGWVVRTLLPARKLFGKDRTKVDFIGTLLHPEAVMAVLMKDPAWTRVRFGAIDRQGDMLWGYAVNAEKLAELRGQFERVGRLDAFDYEYMSSVPLDDGVALAYDKITYIIHPQDWYQAMAVVCDPAISENPKADFCTIGAIGMSKHGDIDIVDFHGEVGMEFDAQSEKIFEFYFAHCLRFDPDNVKVGIEAVAYQRALVSTVRSKMFEKSKVWGPRAFFDVTPIKHGKTAKPLRIHGILAPRMRSGHINMRYKFPTLFGQIQYYGQPGTKDDGPDMVAMGISLLDPYAGTLANVANDDDEEPAGILDMTQWNPSTRKWRKAP